MDLANFPLVEDLIIIKQGEAKEEAELFGSDPKLTSDQALEQIRREFDMHGPYALAKWNNMLVNGSGEELAIQFMTVYNSAHPGTY